jgi:hypothetical protein
METGASGGGWPSAQLKLAAVYRTVHWVVAHPEALDEQRYLGSNCGRLMDQAIGLLPEAAASEKEPLLRARALLAGFEGRPAPARLDALQHLLDELAPIVERGVLEPPPVVAATPEPAPAADRTPSAPATPAPAASAPEANVAPARSRRRVWDGSGADAWADVGMESAKSDEDRYSAAAWLVDEPKPPAEERKSRRRRRDRGDRPSENDRPSERAEAKAEAPTGEARRPSLEQLIADAKRSGKKKTAKPRVEEPPAVPLPLGHPDGTGRSVRTLAGITATEADALEQAGIATIADVLLVPPASHERYPLVHPGAPAPEGNVTVRGRLR